MANRVREWAVRGRVGLCLLALIVVAGFAGVADACPTCKDSLAHTDPASQALVRGYFWSILFMMSMPFLILTGIGGYFYYEIRRARAQQALQQTLVPISVTATVPLTTR